jgi:hypothetical protein
MLWQPKTTSVSKQTAVSHCLVGRSFNLTLLFAATTHIGIATGYWLADRRFAVRVLIGSRIISFQRRLYVLEGSIAVVKWSEREADHSPSTSAEVKKTWIYTCIPPNVFMV